MDSIYWLKSHAIMVAYICSTSVSILWSKTMVSLCCLTTLWTQIINFTLSKDKNKIWCNHLSYHPSFFATWHPIIHFFGATWHPIIHLLVQPGIQSSIFWCNLASKNPSFGATWHPRIHLVVHPNTHLAGR